MKTFSRVLTGSCFVIRKESERAFSKPRKQTIYFLRKLYFIIIICLVMSSYFLSCCFLANLCEHLHLIVFSQEFTTTRKRKKDMKESWFMSSTYIQMRNLILKSSQKLLTGFLVFQMGGF